MAESARNLEPIPLDLSRSLIYTEKDTSALEMKRAGRNYAEISRALALPSAGIARECVDRALEMEGREWGENARSLDIYRCEYAIMKIWDRVEEGRIDAIDKLVKLMDHRAKLLGLYTSGLQPKDPREALAAIMGKEVGALPAVMKELKTKHVRSLDLVRMRATFEGGNGNGGNGQPEAIDVEPGGQGELVPSDQSVAPGETS